jgi:NAD(P)-dependent dehydrogenase (short-subunit alcohol dehydrogenase family)
MTKETALAGRRALVAGGSGGIGRALARLLAARGARIVLHGGSSPERLRAALGEVRAAGDPEAEGFLLDCREDGAAERLLERAGEPDILVCAWGPFRRGSLEETRPEDWRSLTLANLAFPGSLVSLALPGMIRRGWGRILLFGGTNTAGIRGFASTAAYSAAKTALGVLAKSVALSAGSRGVSCNVVCPGLTDTEYLDPAARDYNRERSPGGKALEPEEIARLGLALLENPPVNGAIVPVDRGLVL